MRRITLSLIRPTDYNLNEITQMNTFDSKYPNITNWIENYGWIELGQDDCSSSMVRVLDEGGMVWEGKTQYKNLDELFNALEKELVEKIKEIE